MGVYMSTEFKTPQQLIDLCNKLGYYRDVGDNIITKCIYCGDTDKRNTGHFYIWKVFPVAHCFRCGENVRIEKWLRDLSGFADDCSINQLKKYYKEVFLRKEEQNNYILLETEHQDGIISDYIEDYSVLNKFVDVLHSRKLYSEKLVSYVQHKVINLSTFSKLNSNETYVGLKSVFSSGLHLRNLDIREVTVQKKRVHFDFFMLASNNTPSVVYVTEGLFDAIAVFKMTLDLDLNINNIAAIVSSVGSFPSDLSRLLTLHKPKMVVMIYDSDTKPNIIKNHYYLYKQMGLTKNNCSIVTVSQPFKDIAEVVANVSPLDIIGYLRSAI
jgi:hypothetical protein